MTPLYPCCGAQLPGPHDFGCPDAVPDDEAALIAREDSESWGWDRLMRENA